MISNLSLPVSTWFTGDILYCISGISRSFSPFLWDWIFRRRCFVSCSKAYNFSVKLSRAEYSPYLDLLCALMFLRYTSFSRIKSSSWLFPNTGLLSLRSSLAYLCGAPQCTSKILSFLLKGRNCVLFSSSWSRSTVNSSTGVMLASC